MEEPLHGARRGPAGGGLHTDVEWVELNQLRTCLDALTALIPAFVASGSRDD